MDLRDAVVMITGAGSGIGRAMALACGHSGALVVCCGRRRQPLEDTATAIRETGGAAEADPVDITSWEDVKGTVDGILTRHGRIDTLINNAGRFASVGPLWESEPDNWWQDVTVNLLGTMHCCRAVVPSMVARNSGILVNLSGGGAATPLKAGSGYGSSKAAILRLTDTLALEFATIEKDVYAVAVDPGFNDTDMTRALSDNERTASWMPHVDSMLTEGQGNTPAMVGDNVVALLQGMRAEFSGRVFGVPFDADVVAADVDALVDGDLQVLRVRRPSG